MIRQTVLQFKLAKTEDTITAHSGLALLGEFAVGTGLLKSTDKYLLKPGSSVGYKPSEYIIPLVLMLNGGGRSLEDIRVIKNGEGLREILKIEKIPSTDAIGDWQRRMGANRGLCDLEKVQQALIKQGMKKDEIKEYTLDIDATGIEAEKESARSQSKRRLNRI